MLPWNHADYFSFIYQITIVRGLFLIFCELLFIYFVSFVYRILVLFFCHCYSRKVIIVLFWNSDLHWSILTACKQFLKIDLFSILDFKICSYLDRGYWLFISNHLFISWQICRRFVFCLAVILACTNHRECTISKKVCFYISIMIGLSANIHSLYVFCTFFCEMELILLIFPVSHPMEVHGTSDCCLGRFYPVGN